MRIRLNDKAVYWPPLPTGEFGRTEYSEPVVLSCKWEDCNEQVMTDDGTEVVSRAKIYFASDILAREWGENIKKLGVMKFGTEYDETSLTDPFANEEAFEVKKVDGVGHLTEKSWRLITVWL